MGDIRRASVLSSLFCAFFLAGEWCYGQSTAAAPRPNIVFILADDLGYEDLGCYGGEFIPTPHIDRMAAEGMRFTQHYAGSTVCAPSRACLLTGQHTGHVYQRANGSLEFRADPQDVCVARLLKNAGYATALVGKSGLSCNSENGQLPNAKGFDHFFGFTSHERAHRHYPPWLWRNGEQVRYPLNHHTDGRHYAGDLFLQDALAFIDAYAAGPFFLHLALQQPHADLNVPQQWREPFIGKFDEVPFAGDHYRAEPNPKATYAGMVAHLDDAVGQVLQKLRELGIERETIVLFSSDNGAMSEGGWSREYFRSSGDLRGGKRDLYEGGIRVPLVAWWPGSVAPHSTSEHISAFWDFVPTACQLAGISLPEETDGISMLPALRSENNQLKHEYLYWELYEQGGKQAVRRGDWKVVRLNVSSESGERIELYNLRLDAREENDISKQHPEIVGQLLGLMESAHRDNELFQMAD